jgi:chitin synthase
MSRPPLPSVSSHDSVNRGDPFADRPRQTHFQEPVRPYDSTVSLQRPFESTTSLPSDFGQGYADDDYVEKLPLTAGETVGHPGGFYPPG